MSFAAYERVVGQETTSDGEETGGTYLKSLLRSVIFGYATGRPTGYNNSGSFTVERTCLTSFSSKVNFRQLTVTKRVLKFHEKRSLFLKRAKSTFCNVQNNAVFLLL